MSTANGSTQTDFSHAPWKCFVIFGAICNNGTFPEEVGMVSVFVVIANLFMRVELWVDLLKFMSVPVV